MRLYNGCPDKALKARWDREYDLTQKIHNCEPEAHCTIFGPPEEGFMVHVWGRPITGLLPSRLAALDQALDILKGRA